MMLLLVFLFGCSWVFDKVHSSGLGIINVSEDDSFLPDPVTKTIFKHNPLVDSFLAYQQAKNAAPALLSQQPFDVVAAPERKDIVGTIGISPAPSAGFIVNTGSLLRPQAEILGLIEAFIRLKAELLGRFHALYNDNFELVHSVINLVLGKLSKLSVFTLNGISILRSILEFAANLFGGWNLSLPSVHVGTAIGGGYPRPHTAYGVPPEAHPLQNLLNSLRR